MRIWEYATIWGVGSSVCVGRLVGQPICGWHTSGGELIQVGASECSVSEFDLDMATIGVELDLISSLSGGRPRSPVMLVC